MMYPGGFVVLKIVRFKYLLVLKFGYSYVWIMLNI